MSNRALSWAFDLTDLTSTEKLVLIALADKARDPDMRCWPSYATLTRMTALHRTTVIRTVTALGKRNLIHIMHRSEDGQNTSNSYQVMVPDGWSHRTTRGSHSATRVVAQSAGGGSTALPKPIEPISNPAAAPQREKSPHRGTRQAGEIVTSLHQHLRR